MTSKSQIFNRKALCGNLACAFETGTVASGTGILLYKSTRNKLIAFVCTVILIAGMKQSSMAAESPKLFAATSGEEVVTWRAAFGTLATNNAFAVKVGGMDIDVIEIPKPTYHLVGNDAHPYYAAFFDADHEVTVKITSPVNMSRTRILPLRKCIAPYVENDHAISFRAKPPFTVVIEPSGRHRALVIAANTLERDAPRPDDPNVIYFGAGRHRCDKPIMIGSGQTLYLAPGAYVEGCVVGDGNNMTIRGRGILSGLPWSWLKGPNKYMCGLKGKNIVVRDVTLMSSWTWMLVFNDSEDVLVDNIKLLNGRVLNDDGIDICSSRHVVIRNSFIRAQDDCIAPKYWCEDLVVENCVLWTDVANIIRIGYECTGRGHPFSNHRYCGIDVLHQAIHNDKSPDDYWINNAISIQPSNDALCEDMIFEDFAFDTAQVQDLFLTLRTSVCRFGKKPIKQGGHARNIKFRNIRFPESRPLGSYGIWLHSVDSDHIVEDIVFEDFKGVQEFHVPVGMRGVVRNVKGLSSVK